MPVLPTVIRAKLSTLLLAVKQRLIDAHVFDTDDQSIISLRMNPPVMALRSDNYAITLPLSQFVDRAWEEGAGRAGMLINGRLNVYVRNRNALDEAWQAESWLTDPQLGILDRVNAVVDALQSSFLGDGELVQDAPDTPTILELVNIAAEMSSSITAMLAAIVLDPGNTALVAAKNALLAMRDRQNIVIAEMRAKLLRRGGNHQVVEGVKLVFWGEPHQRYEQVEFGDVVVELAIRYLLDIEQTGD